MSINLSHYIDSDDPCNDPQYRSMLENLQSNILKSHGRDYSAHLFLEFRGDPDDVKFWIRDFASRYVTSARQQLLETQARRQQPAEQRGPGALIGCFFLSAQGYETLGFSTEDAEQEESFRKGMKNQDDYKVILARLKNRDPRPEAWEAPFRGNIHALILLAHADEDVLKQQVEEVRREAAPFAQVLGVEYGKVLRNDKDQPIEHFGYVDGRSQPLFLKQDIDEEQGEGGIDKWDPSAPLGLLITRDPFVGDDDSYGSYFVFRKLEQNVGGFVQRVEELAQALEPGGNAAKRAGAMVVGRFRDGTPLTLQETDGLDMSGHRRGIVNNFNYGPPPGSEVEDKSEPPPFEPPNDDGLGFKCPLHAHIRKVSPRMEVPGLSEAQVRGKRIARRGVPYGERAANLSDAPTEGVGLLFMCYQSDIHDQFEFLQRAWVDNRNFPAWVIHPRVGDDPLIGQDPGPGASQKEWPKEWGNADFGRESIEFNFEGFVTLKGGEYFFAPSLTFLNHIAQ